MCSVSGVSVLTLDAAGVITVPAPIMHFLIHAIASTDRERVWPEVSGD